ncbi:hypothetical protein [Streptomyces sp. NPDC050804]|uniref:hypothetical protein n=1 Tax=Streptomyces sp. NPDC050804 TaxID=3154745 RepID=UPI00342CAEE9
MLATTLAILGTLLGAIVSGWFALRTAGRSERVARDGQLRRDRLDAVTELATAISAHRRAMWMRGRAQLKGAPAARYEELRSESHLTRSAVARPLVSLRLLITDPAVHTAADAMVTATYAMRGADTSNAELTTAREAAMHAHDRFVDTAAAYLNHS